MSHVPGGRDRAYVRTKTFFPSLAWARTTSPLSKQRVGGLSILDMACAVSWPGYDHLGITEGFGRTPQPFDCAVCPKTRRFNILTQSVDGIAEP